MLGSILHTLRSVHAVITYVERLRDLLSVEEQVVLAESTGGGAKSPHAVAFSYPNIIQTWGCIDVREEQRERCCFPFVFIFFYYSYFHCIRSRWIWFQFWKRLRIDFRPTFDFHWGCDTTIPSQPRINVPVYMLLSFLSHVNLKVVCTWFSNHTKLLLSCTFWRKRRQIQSVRVFTL